MGVARPRVMVGLAGAPPRSNVAPSSKPPATPAPARSMSWKSPWPPPSAPASPSSTRSAASSSISAAAPPKSPSARWAATVVSTSIRVAGDEIDQSIITYARQVHNMQIRRSHRRTDQDRRRVRLPLEREREITLRGRDLSTSLPKSVDITTVELRDAISGSINTIVDAVRRTLRQPPPELIADMMSQGMALAGGGALLPRSGSVCASRQETHFPSMSLKAPLTCCRARLHRSALRS